MCARHVSPSEGLRSDTSLRIAIKALRPISDVIGHMADSQGQAPGIRHQASTWVFKALRKPARVAQSGRPYQRELQAATSYIRVDGDSARPGFRLHVVRPERCGKQLHFVRANPAGTRARRCVSCEKVRQYWSSLSGQASYGLCTRRSLAKQGGVWGPR